MRRITSTTTTAARRSLTRSLVLAGGLLVIAPSLRAQTLPPIDGVTGTIAPGASVQADGAIHAVIARTADGVEHLFHYAKALFVHPKKGGDAEERPAAHDSTTATSHDAAPAAGDQRANTADVRTTR